MGAGARSIGLGGSFTGLADDANAMYYNIAGIGQLKETTFSGSYTPYMAGFFEGNASLVYPIFKSGAIGVSWTDTVASGYSENTITLGYSLPLARKIFAGVGARMFMKNYSGIDMSAFGVSTVNASGFGLCLSGFSKIDDEISFGFSLENLNQPSVALKYADPVAAIYRVGASYKLMKDLTAAAQFDARNGETKVGAGAEYWINAGFLESLGIKDSSMGVRAGYVLGTSSLSNLSAGFSFFLPTNMLDLRLDYALTFPFGYIDGISTHRLTLNISEPKPLHNI